MLAKDQRHEYTKLAHVLQNMELNAKISELSLPKRARLATSERPPNPGSPAFPNGAPAQPGANPFFYLQKLARSAQVPLNSGNPAYLATSHMVFPNGAPAQPGANPFVYPPKLARSAQALWNSGNPAYLATSHMVFPNGAPAQPGLQDSHQTTAYIQQQASQPQPNDYSVDLSKYKIKVSKEVVAAYKKYLLEIEAEHLTKPNKKKTSKQSSHNQYTQPLLAWCRSTKKADDKNERILTCLQHGHITINDFFRSYDTTYEFLYYYLEKGRIKQLLHDWHLATPRSRKQPELRILMTQQIKKGEEIRQIQAKIRPYLKKYFQEFDKTCTTLPESNQQTPPRLSTSPVGLIKSNQNKTQNSSQHTERHEVSPDIRRSHQP